jgi:hypothetical protein
MLLRVNNLNCMLWFFGAYMIIQHWACCLGESRKAILDVCIATRILAQEDWRTRYVTLRIVASFQLTIHGEEREQSLMVLLKTEKSQGSLPIRSWSSNWRRLKPLDQESILYLKERKESGNLDNAGAEGLVCETCRTGHLWSWHIILMWCTLRKTYAKTLLECCLKLLGWFGRDGRKIKSTHGGNWGWWVMQNARSFVCTFKKETKAVLW